MVRAKHFRILLIGQLIGRVKPQVPDRVMAIGLGDNPVTEIIVLNKVVTETTLFALDNTSSRPAAAGGAGEKFGLKTTGKAREFFFFSSFCFHAA